MLLEYYRAAPRIVAIINLAPDRRAIFGEMFSTVRRAVVEIEAGEYDRALITYRRLFDQLHHKYSYLN
jgi:hypothetical protein